MNTRSLKLAVPALLQWYQQNKRDLPWRKTQDPYHIWVSEIMLQQTRVEAVKEYYVRFLQVLPTLHDLAVCPQDKLLKLWEGLGYYNRVKNMQKAAIQIESEFGGSFPQDYLSLQKLKGIGAYTARAISSIAFGEPQAVVDGNVLRVYARFFATSADISTEQTRKEVQADLNEVIPTDNAGDFNQAMMELGATVCVPNGIPSCATCPVKNQCLAYSRKEQLLYPVKAAKPGRKSINYTVFLLQCDNRMAVKKRTDKGVLNGLYELPNKEGFLSADEAKQFVTENYGEVLSVTPMLQAKHIFSHLEWQMIGYHVLLKQTDSPEFLPAETVFRDLSLPSAFRTFTEYAKRVFCLKGE